MEQVKIKINEIESMTLKIPTEFSAYSFNKLFDQLVTIGKSMPDLQLGDRTISFTPHFYRMANWQDEEECLEILRIWENEGKNELIEWFKREKQKVLEPVEISKMAQFISGIRTKYKDKKV